MKGKSGRKAKGTGAESQSRRSTGLCAEGGARGGRLVTAEPLEVLVTNMHLASEANRALRAAEEL